MKIRIPVCRDCGALAVPILTTFLPSVRAWKCSGTCRRLVTDDERKSAKLPLDSVVDPITNGVAPVWVELEASIVADTEKDLGVASMSAGSFSSKLSENEKARLEARATLGARSAGGAEAAADLKP